MADYVNMFEVDTLVQSKILDATLLRESLANLCGFDYGRKWMLLYRASEHGFSARDFHFRCDEMPDTLTIIKSSNGNIFGGFVDATWQSKSQYKQSDKAFIFSLINQCEKPFKADVTPAKSNRAIYCDANNGPSFGSGLDIYISNNSNAGAENYSNFSLSYVHPDYAYGSTQAKSILAGSYNFKVSDIEVFKMY